MVDEPIGPSGTAEELSWRQVAVEWFAPVASRPTWEAAGYLAGGLALSWVWFVAVVVLLSVGLPLVIAVVGIPLMLVAFAAIRKMAGVERRRAALVGEDIPERPLADGPGLFSRFKARMGDGARWRQVACLLGLPVVAAMCFAGAVAAWAVVGYLISLPLWSWAVGSSIAWSVFLALAGVAAIGVATRATILFAKAEVLWVRWLLGPDRVADMERRVEDLTANRQEILDAVAVERRRIERNLHDGVQQRLVALGIDIGLAASKLSDDPEEAAVLLEGARDKTRTAIAELRTIGRGLHPAILEDRGLDAALSAVVADSPIPIELRCSVGRELPVDVQETAYFVVAEAVANILKHARARTASVDVHEVARGIRIVVDDDGNGGARADGARGSGLAGIAARVHGLDGSFRLESPAGGPTRLEAEIPCRPPLSGLDDPDRTDLLP